MGASTSIHDNALFALVRERGAEMSPALRALVGVASFWLWMLAVLGPCAALYLAIALMGWLYPRVGTVGLLACFVVALAATAGIVVGIRRLGQLAARKIAGRLRARLDDIGRLRPRLDGIGGGLTPTSFSLGPPRDGEG